MKALIIDDERLARDRLSRLLRSQPEVEIAGEATNVEEGLLAIRRHNPDVIFLDVEMPGGNAFDLLARLDDVPLTVFTTAFDAYAVRAFDASALDYLVKPISPERLEAALAKVRKVLDSAAREPAPSGAARSKLHQIFVRDGERCWIVRLDDILLMESEGNYTRLCFGNERPLIFRSLTALEARLDPSVFFRANRSQILNLRRIENVEEEVDGRLVVRLARGPRVEISRRQSQRLRKLLSF